MTDAQRQYYLRQQLKAIQEELGEGERQRDRRSCASAIEQANLPEHVQHGRRRARSTASRG